MVNSICVEPPGLRPSSSDFPLGCARVVGWTRRLGAARSEKGKWAVPEGVPGEPPGGKPSACLSFLLTQAFPARA